MGSQGRDVIRAADAVVMGAGAFGASGCCVGGLSISPAVGEVLADWVVDGETPLDLTSLSVTRFGPEVDSEERLRETCLWRYAHHYSDQQRPPNTSA